MILCQNISKRFYKIFEVYKYDVRFDSQFLASNQVFFCADPSVLNVLCAYTPYKHSDKIHIDVFCPNTVDVTQSGYHFNVS